MATEADLSSSISTTPPLPLTRLGGLEITLTRRKTDIEIISALTEILAINEPITKRLALESLIMTTEQLDQQFLRNHEAGYVHLRPVHSTSFEGISGYGDVALVGSVMHTPAKMPTVIVQTNGRRGYISAGVGNVHAIYYLVGTILKDSYLSEHGIDGSHVNFDPRLLKLTTMNIKGQNVYLAFYRAIRSDDKYMYVVAGTASDPANQIEIRLPNERLLSKVISTMEEVGFDVDALAKMFKGPVISISKAVNIPYIPPGYH